MRAFVLLTAVLISCSGEVPDKKPSSAAPPSASAPAGPLVASSATVDVVPSGSADVVSGASEAYTGPAVLTEGKLDGAALRARNVARLKEDVSPVVALTGTDAVALGKELCDKIVPKRSAATPVLLKPNIGGFDSIKDPAKSAGDDGVRGRITNPEFVRGVIRCLKARGHTKITVADGWGGGHSYWQKLVDVSGYAKMAQQEGVPLVCMCDDGVFDATGDRPGKPFAVTGMERTNVPSLLLPKVLAEHLSGGLFIEIPKLKAHRFSVVSLGIKNMQGVVMTSQASPAHRQKWRMHAELNDYLKGKTAGNEDRALYVSAIEKFAKRMVDVVEVAAPDVVLLDGTPAMQGDGFQKMVPISPWVAIGGTNVVRVDQAGAMLLGAWKNQKLALALRGHETSPLITEAAKRFGVDFATTKIEGSGAATVQEPRGFAFKAMAPFELAGGTPSPSPAPSSGAREAHAASLGSDTITLDGSLDDAAWSRATPISFDTDYKGRSTGITTKARFVWSASAFYAGFEVEGTAFAVDTSHPTDRDRARLYEEDCVELFIGPDPAQRTRYFEIEVGPFGHFLDLAIDRPAKREDVGWNSGLKVGVKRDPAARRAVIEISLNNGDITKALVQGAKLPFAVYRMEGKVDRKHLAWSPTLTDKPSFHVPERFGTLVLD